MGRCVVEFHVFMSLQPFVVFGFMDIQVVQNNMDFTVAMPGHERA